MANELQPLPILFHDNQESFDIDVLDENLYSYENTVFTFTPAIQDRTSGNLLQRVIQYADSVPAFQKAADYMQSKTDYVLRLDLLPKEILQALQNGTAELMPSKSDSEAVFLKIRDVFSKKVLKEIPLGTKTIPADITSAMQCLSMQAQLNQIAAGLREISEACEFNFSRIIQGQRDDRIARLLSSRSCFIQALAISDDDIQRQMFLQAIGTANAARAELAFQIKSDILLLGGGKTLKSKDMEKIVYDINTAIAAMNNAVQLSLYSYQTLGQHNAQLAVVKEHETFTKQVLLKEIDFRGEKHIAWRLICSSGNSESFSQDFNSLPTKLINSCQAYIESRTENMTVRLEEEVND